MGQNNDTREHGDKQGQQGGQLDKSSKTINPQEPQRQQEQRPGSPDENIAGGSDKDKKANQ